MHLYNIILSSLFSFLTGKIPPVSAGLIFVYVLCFLALFVSTCFCFVFDNQKICVLLSKIKFITMCSESMII